MTNPSAEDVLSAVNPAAALEYEHIKGAVTGEKDHFPGETGLTKVPGIGSAYKPFKDGWDAIENIGKGNVSEAATDVAGLAADTTSFASEAAGAIADPLNWLITKGLGFLEDVVFPLKELLELVTGDGDALDKSAEKFDEIAAELKKLAEQVEQTATQGAQGWSGDAAPSAGQSVGTTKQSIEEAAESAGHVATMLKVSSMLMKAAYDIINGIIADVVEQLIITWVTAQAAAPVTLGASEAAAMGASVAEVGAGVARATPKVTKVTEILQKITKFIQKIMKILKESKIGKLLKDTKLGKDIKALSKEGGAFKKFMGKEGAGGKVLKGEEGNVGLKDTAKNLAKELGRKPTRDEIFTQNVKDNLGNWIGHSAKEQALDQLGIPGKKPDSGLDWAEKGSEFVHKNMETFNDISSAVQYSADPGAQAEEKEQEESGGDANDPGSEASESPSAEIPDVSSGAAQPSGEGVNPYGFPTEDPDRDRPR